MLTLIMILGFMTALLWISFKVTGALFTLAIWLFIKVPLALILGVIGVLCCVTILLIPLGAGCIKLAFRLLIPG